MSIDIGLEPWQVEEICSPETLASAYKSTGSQLRKPTRITSSPSGAHSLKLTQSIVSYLMTWTTEKLYPLLWPLAFILSQMFRNLRINSESETSRQQQMEERRYASGKGSGRFSATVTTRQYTNPRRFETWGPVLAHTLYLWAARPCSHRPTWAFPRPSKYWAQAKAQKLWGTGRKLYLYTSAWGNLIFIRQTN